MQANRFFILGFLIISFNYSTNLKDKKELYNFKIETALSESESNYSYLSKECIEYPEGLILTIKAALQEFPNEGRYWFDLALFYELYSNTFEFYSIKHALTLYKKALKLNYYESSFRLARIYMSLNKLDLSLNYLDYFINNTNDLETLRFTLEFLNINWDKNHLNINFRTVFIKVLKKYALKVSFDPNYFNTLINTKYFHLKSYLCIGNL